MLLKIVRLSPSAMILRIASPQSVCTCVRPVSSESPVPEKAKILF